MDTSKIPPFVSHVTKKLQEAGFEAYLVGGCVRDTFRGETPHDWDITTNAHPEQIQLTFSELKTLNDNDFGTVTVLNMSPERNTRLSSVARPEGDAEGDETKDGHEYEQVQITTYRSESTYSDTRRPDTVSYETVVTKDLERRDFTMNAIAWDPIKDSIIDPFGGIKDIKDKIIRCVLYPTIRFQEDALRMLRAVRFSTVLDFAISHETFEAITANADLLSKISGERIRDEFLKMINSPRPALGVTLLEKTGLLKFVIPELYEGIGCEQKGAHIFDVYQHLLHALQHAADKGLSTEIRLTALFHDIGKPATRRYDAKKDKYTFFGHEVVGARITKKVLERLRVPRETADLVVSLVRNHMFFSDTEQITLSAVRRVITKVGPEHIWQLMEVRECDRVGMKKAEAPYRLRKYHAMIDEALRDPISVSQLKVDGRYLIETLHMKPGPRMGWILHALLEEVLEDPSLNTIETLTEHIRRLENLPDAALKELGEKGKEKKEEVNEGEIKDLRDKHKVK
jgi:poly(A) polymerase/tRNA nucleotidyltransferase (CCA-adding enzyme)